MEFLLFCKILVFFIDYFNLSPLHYLHLNEALDFSSQNGTGHTVTIEYCDERSYYRRDVLWKKAMLESQFPGIDVALVNYLDAPWRRAVGKTIPGILIGSAVSVAAGDKVFPWLGITPPGWFYRISANKSNSIYFILLSRGLFKSLLYHNGAFEVYLDGNLVFSKLDQQRFLKNDELRHFIGEKLRDSAIIS